MMRMELKLLDVVNSKEVLKRLVLETIPVQMAYRLVKIVRAVNQELEAHEYFSLCSIKQTNRR